MGKGKRFELDLKNAVNAATRPWVKAHRPDFSGSSVGEVADVMVLWQANRYDDQVPCGHPERHVAYVEAKKRQCDEGKRVIVASGSSEDEDGVDELLRMKEETPAWTDKYFAVKFQNRELIVLELDALLHYLLRDEEGWGDEYCDSDLDLITFHGARLTRGGNVSMIKPTLDTWESSRSGKADAIKLLHEIGVENYDIKEDHR